MAFTLRQLRRALTRKLGFSLDAGRRHPTFFYVHQGKIVAITHISHGGGRDVSEGIISTMARQVGVEGPQLRAAIDCSLQPSAFIEAMLRKSH